MNNLLEKNLNSQVSFALTKGISSINKILKNQEYSFTPYFNNSYSFSYGLSGLIYGLDKLEILEFKQLIPSLQLQIQAQDNNDNFFFSLSRGKFGALLILFLENGSDELQLKIKHLIAYYITMNAYSTKKNFSLFTGLSGIGATSLKLFELTKDHDYYNYAHTIFAIITFKRKTLSSFGLGYGNTGIAYFLVSYAKTKITNNKEKEIALRLAKFYILYDIRNGKIENSSKKIRGIKSNIENKIPYIYIPFGSSGIIKTIIYYISNFPDKDLQNAVYALSNSLDVKATINCGYLLGTSGLIDTLLDVLNLGKDFSYLKEQLTFLTRSLLSSCSYKNSLLLFPADQNFNCAIDYGSGMIGVLLTFQRLITGKRFDPLFTHFINERR